MTNEQVAWAAGFFDGEGYVSIASRMDHSQYIKVGINHVDPRPLQKFQQLFGGKLNYSSKVRGNRKPRWSWVLSCNQAKEFLLLIKPYLINKDIVTEIAIEFLSTISKTKLKLPQEITDIRLDCAKRLKLINSET